MRKNPRQERSRQTVERIIAAGRSVLSEHGYDAFSTNRVAAQAGVSPGSLYQYFPDKSAILTIVIDRYWDEVAEEVAASLSRRGTALTQPPATMVRAMADALLTALEGDPALLRVLTQELPQSANRERRAALERRVRDLVGTYIGLLTRGERSDVDLSAWIVVLAVENIALRWSLDRPDFDRDQVLDEITGLVVAYLTP